MRITRRVLLALVLTAAAVDVVAFLLAFATLSDGPSALGYDRLGFATAAAILVSLLVVLTVAAGTGSLRLRLISLAVASAVSGVTLFGLSVLGQFLAELVVSDASFNPEQPIYSIVLAIGAEAQVLAPVPVILAAGVLVIAAPTLWRRVRRGSASMAAQLA